MKWVKAPDELRALIEKAMESKPCEKRPMFGYPAYFANGYMSAGLFQDKVFIRLSPSQQESLARRFGPLPPLEPMPGRPMTGYLVIPEKLYRDPSAFDSVIDEALSYAQTLPPKAKKSPMKSAPKTRAKKSTKGRGARG